MATFKDYELELEMRKEKIANRLRTLRKEAGLTQAGLAEKLGYSEPTIKRWEKRNGESRIPTMEQLFDLATLYHCEIGYLLGEYDCKTRVATDICKETGLSEETVNIMRGYDGIDMWPSEFFDAHVESRHKKNRILDFLLKKGFWNILDSIDNEFIRSSKWYPYYDFPSQVQYLLRELFVNSGSSSKDYYQNEIVKYFYENPTEINRITQQLKDSNIEYKKRIYPLDFNVLAVFYDIFPSNEEIKNNLEVICTNLCSDSWDFLNLNRTKNYRLYDIQTQFMDIVKKYIESKSE